MLSVFFGFFSLVFVLFGVFVVFEYRSYTDEQRARAPRLLTASLISGVVLCLVGVGAIVWLLSGRTVWAVSGVLSVAALLPCLIQYGLFRKLDGDQSPLTTRINTKVARTLNFPEHDH